MIVISTIADLYRFETTTTLCVINASKHLKAMNPE